MRSARNGHGRNNTPDPRHRSFVKGAPLPGRWSMVQKGNDRPPFNGIVTRGLGGRIRTGSAPKFSIEGGARGAEFDMAVTPQDIDPERILAGGMSQGTPSVDQIRHHGAFGA